MERMADVINWGKIMDLIYQGKIDVRMTQFAKVKFCVCVETSFCLVFVD